MQKAIHLHKIILTSNILLTFIMTRTIQEKMAKRKKVLLIGNGPFRIGEKNSWNDIVIKYIAGKDGVSKENKYKTVPLPLLAQFIDIENENISHKSRVEYAFKNYKYSNNENLKEDLKEYINCQRFDAILTTNYTYELENLFYVNHNYDEVSKNIKLNKYVKATEGSKEKGLFIKTFNLINDKSIWHIHGELRNPNSVVLTQSQYTGLLEKIKKYYYERKNYKKENLKDIKYNSWIDYFLFGDVTIVGFGFDYSEIDLWWLLSKRRNISNAGKMIFHSLTIDEEKENLFKNLKVTTKTSKNELYKEHYSYIFKSKA